MVRAVTKEGFEKGDTVLFCRRVEVLIYTIHINIGICSVTVVKDFDSVRKIPIVLK